MKFLYKNQSRAIAVLSVLFIGLTLQSCSKEDKKQNLLGDEAKLIVSVTGITEPSSEVSGKLRADAAAKRLPLKENEIVPSQLRSLSGFDALVSLKKGEQYASKVKIKGAQSSGSGDGLMAAAVEAGVKYRLLIYKQTGEFVSSNLLTSGEAGAVLIRKGFDYNWYAVSYNNTDDIPDVDPNNPDLVLPEGTDVLYAQGTFSVAANASDDNIPLGIVFQHSFSRIAVELNTMGMFAGMENADVSVSGPAVKTGTLDLTTGTISNLTAVNQTIDFASFTDVNADFSDRKVAYIYTAEPTATDLVVTMNGLELAIDDGSTRSFNTLLSAEPLDFTFNITPVLGSTLTAQINLIESPLTFDGVQWARQNLYYEAGHNPYRFHHTYAHTNARNTYFSFKGLVPGQFGVNSDPCTQVYPAGVWRQANQADFQSLTGGLLGIGGQSVTYGTVGSLGYFEYDMTSGAAAPYPSDNLRFNFNGEGFSIGLVEDLIEIDLGTTYGSTAQVWTSTAGLDLLGLVGLGAVHYDGTRGLLNSNDDFTSATLLSVSAIGLDVLETNFKNVRCVRAATAAP